MTTLMRSIAVGGAGGGGGAAVVPGEEARTRGGERRTRVTMRPRSPLVGQGTWTSEAFAGSQGMCGACS